MDLTAVRDRFSKIVSYAEENWGTICILAVHEKLFWGKLMYEPKRKLFFILLNILSETDRLVIVFHRRGEFLSPMWHCIMEQNGEWIEVPYKHSPPRFHVRKYL